MQFEQQRFEPFLLRDQPCFEQLLQEAEAKEKSPETQDPQRQLLERVKNFREQGIRTG